MKTEKVYFENPRGQKLCGVLSVPEFSRTVVVMAHGFGSNKDGASTKALSDELNKKGISTFRFDFSGRGESEGSIEQTTISDAIEDLKSAINYVYEMFDKVCLYGSSFGGIVSLGYVSKENKIILLALKSPVSSYVEKRETELGEDGIKKWREQGFMDYTTGDKLYMIPYKFYEDSFKYSYNFYEYIKIPVFIVHGNKDEEVPVSQSLKLAKHLKSAKLDIIKGADHRYTNKQHFSKSVKAIADWFDESLKSTE